ncbi:PRD domain protein [Levilactobacillus paucivorans]|uniref:PRD domain protein n=1 Tax=Levilactobacillus paucivorans TaxID=616990 RepID=A0A0R2LHE9_9LACO|nr:PRD domain-containing protein [Levilactobacillus paucivorans]KRO01220.1 PRD domain protein [Levilactobacillus paucivorans]
MVKTDINRELMNLLYQQDSYVTAKKLSEQLEVSPKTVYRTINHINEKVGAPQLITTAKGKGVEINRSRSLNESGQFVQHDLAKLSEDTLSPSKRRKQVMIRLLYVSPRAIDVQYLYEHFYVSDSVISNDEKIINQWLDRYGLRLQRTNRKASIQGDELAVRQAISVLTDLTGIIDFDNIFSRSEVALNQVDVNFVIDLIRDAEKDLEIEIPYPYDVNLFSHIYILINRYRNVGQKGSLPASQVPGTITQNKELLHCAEVLSHRIEQYAHVNLPQTEISFIYEYLESSRITNLSDRTEVVPQRAILIADDYVRQVSRLLQIEIDGKAILPDLINHVRPMLNRLENGIHATNELLEQIKQEYPTIFNAVCTASLKIGQDYELPKIPVDESAFISIYFARAVEQSTRALHILIACTTGVGTAELLRVKVSKNLPELVIDDVVSMRQYQVNRQQYSGVDFIISTIPIRDEQVIPVIVVSALFSARDQAAIRKVVTKLSGATK